MKTIVCLFFKIQRVQNPVLYQQYKMKEHELKTHNPPYTENEKKLWYSTDIHNINKIIANGFQHQYCRDEGKRWLCESVCFICSLFCQKKFSLDKLNFMSDVRREIIANTWEKLEIITYVLKAHHTPLNSILKIGILFLSNCTIVYYCTQKQAWLFKRYALVSQRSHFYYKAQTMDKGSASKQAWRLSKTLGGVLTPSWRWC